MLIFVLGGGVVGRGVELARCFCLGFGFFCPVAPAL